MGTTAITVCEPPLPQALSDELVHFWQDTFQTDYQAFRSVLNGEEREHNRDIFYLVQQRGQTVGTCHLTIPASNPELGGLGEVATAPEFRSTGIANALCTRARDDFSRTGGQALFLGTVNPTAARVYHRLGWRKLAGANVMAFVSDQRSPEAFLVDYFKGSAATTIVAGSSAARVPMIPLILSPHDWQLIDANTELVSTRYADQNSCMGLYPRYAALEREKRGAWFSAQTGRGHTVGLASTRLDGADGCQVDGFAHHDYADVWEDLLTPTISWTVGRGVDTCWMSVLCADEEKAVRAGQLGFHQAGAATPRKISGRQVNAIRLERSAA
jgi:GNAT superfamily N-acetyltransferase